MSKSNDLNLSIYCSPYQAANYYLPITINVRYNMMVATERNEVNDINALYVAVLSVRF